MKRVKKIMLLGLMALFCRCQSNETPQTQTISAEHQAKVSSQQKVSETVEILDSVFSWRDKSHWTLELQRKNDESDSARNRWEHPHTTLKMVNRDKDLSVVIPEPSPKNCSSLDHIASPIIKAVFSPDFEDGMPKYVYCEIPMYATDSQVFRYEVKTGKYISVHHGVLNEVLGSGNLSMTYTGFRTDSNGELMEGRGCFDIVVSPDGKVLWDSGFYF